MTDDLVSNLLPVLGRSLERGFNVFDVMHHGTHEKQISNVFGWLLDVGGSHNLHDRFLQIFIDEVNAATPAPPLPHETYRVRQEVNTGVGIDEVDIADLVLEGPTAVVVVENYFTSDGHGHSYERCLAYGHREGKQAAVVLLCRDAVQSRQSQGWEHAPVLTYGRLIARLGATLDRDARYQRKNPDAYAFLGQMHRKFVSEGGLVGEQDVLNFMTAMCDTGEVRRYQVARHDEAAEQFASDLAAQARERFNEGREVLRRIKALLRDFASGPLKDQLNVSLMYQKVLYVPARYSGVYLWTLNLSVVDKATGKPESTIQLKFGPSTWKACEDDPYWKGPDPLSAIDYSCIFAAHLEAHLIRQTTVTLQDVLDGLEPTDTRLHDEVIQLLQEDVTAHG